MMGNTRDIAFEKMRERAKELKCLYAVDELLAGNDDPIDKVLGELVTIIPSGWQHTTCCEALIVYEGREFFTQDLKKTKWYQKADLVIDENYAGEVRVYYTINVHGSDDPFLPEEQKLLNNIAQRISQFIFHRKLKKTVDYIKESPSARKSADDGSILTPDSDDHWRWRQMVIEKLVNSMDMKKLGVKAAYIIGSTKTATAGPGSDIDLLVHFEGDADQKNMLESWVDGWRRSVSFINYERPCYKVNGSLIDLHIITDNDIKEGSSYASMIGASENSARLLKSITE